MRIFNWIVDRWWIHKTGMTREEALKKYREHVEWMNDVRRMNRRIMSSAMDVDHNLYFGNRE